MGAFTKITRWKLCLAILVAVQVVATAFLHRGYALNCVTDTLQSLVLVIGTAATLANLRSSRGPVGEFWFAMSCGMVLWTMVTLMWAWWEVVLKQSVPDPFVGDVFLFLHVAAMIGAFARRPHRAEYWNQALGAFDLSQLLLWWVYFYAFVVFPWQFLVVDKEVYGAHFNELYAAEHALLLAIIVVLLVRTSGVWRRVYAGYFAAALLYALFSLFANLAIDAGEYFSGSKYDVALIISMAWFGWVALSAGEMDLQGATTGRAGTEVTFWPGRLALLALASLPVLLLWTLLHSAAPPRVLEFRLVLTLLMTFGSAALIGVREEIVHRAVLQLVRGIRDDYDKVTSMRGQLLESENLTSLGRLVAGATHEINNPLTAILGFSEILADDDRISEQNRGRARLIREQALSIKRTVTELIKARTSYQARAEERSQPVARS